MTPLRSPIVPGPPDEPRYPVAHSDPQSHPPTGAREGANEINPTPIRRIPRGKWGAFKKYLNAFFGISITLLIFAGILRPVVQKWPQVHERILQTDPWCFLLAAVMFAMFLFGVRALSWRNILSGLGHRLPLAPMIRIWSTSELARYIPGVIWQVVGRAILARPYGVSGSICSVSQVLELAIFLLANILLAITCLLYFGVRNMGAEARPYLFATMALVPVLLLVLHPRVFYGLLNRIMHRLKKPEIARRLPGRRLVELVIWAVIGLLWQSFAIWLIVSKPLGLPINKWWIVAGAYCLAWCGGFLAFWAPGGLGVREFIFVFAMKRALPERVHEIFAADEVALAGFLAFLGVLLRLWATLGELILASIAYVLDFRGALGRPDAPGRVGSGNGSTLEKERQ